ncbi:MAG: hypothetical protein ACFFER_11185 [Candidatus Thorarchaeota archaeon]
MSDEHADHHLGEMIEGQCSTAIGWSEVRNALESIERMRATGLEDARLNLVERERLKDVRFMSLVLVVGKVRQYEDDLYLTVEIARELDDPNYIGVHLWEQYRAIQGFKAAEPDYSAVNTTESMLEAGTELGWSQEMISSVVFDVPSIAASNATVSWDPAVLS